MELNIDSISIDDNLKFGNSSFVHKQFLNEIVTGQKEDYVIRSLEVFNEKLNINFNNYYILLTGIKKEIYFNVYNIGAAEYMRIFTKIEDIICKYMTDNNYPCELFMFVYFNTKQICIIFNRGEHSNEEVGYLAEYTNEVIQKIYEQEIFKGDERYFNFTVMSPLLDGYEQLAPAFKKLQDLDMLSFFHNSHIVMTYQKMSEWKKEFTYTQAQHLLTEIIESVTAGQVNLCENLLKELFLEQMRTGYNISLCWDIMTEIKRQVYNLNIILDLNLDEEIEKKFKINAYPNIFEMYKTVDYILRICTNEVIKNGKKLSGISLEAIKYIKENYNKNISLNDIAEHIKVAPNYLSGIFNKEMKISITRYLTNIRIDKSKKLLIESNLKIFEVAKSVGIEDSNYYGKIFKKHENITPYEFRKKNKNIQKISNFS